MSKINSSSHTILLNVNSQKCLHLTVWYVFLHSYTYTHTLKHIPHIESFHISRNILYKLFCTLLFFFKAVVTVLNFYFYFFTFLFFDHVLEHVGSWKIKPAPPALGMWSHWEVLNFALLCAARTFFSAGHLKLIHCSGGCYNIHCRDLPWYV